MFLLAAARVLAPWAQGAKKGHFGHFGPFWPGPTEEVTQNGVILGHFDPFLAQNGPFWPILGHFGPYGQNDPILGYFLCRYWPKMAQNGHFGPFWAILGHFGPKWPKMTPFWVTSSVGTGPDWPKGPKWPKMAQNGPFWPSGPQGPKSHSGDH